MCAAPEPTPPADPPRGPLSNIYQRPRRPAAVPPDWAAARARRLARQRRLVLGASLVALALIVGGLTHLTWRARRRIARAGDVAPAAPGRLAALEYRLAIPPPAADREAFGLVRQAYAHLQAGRTVDAQRLLRLALERQPDYDPALRLLGLLYLRTGRHADALHLFTRALRHAATRAESLNNLATVLMREDRLDAAERRLLEALALQPDHPAANLNLALLYMTWKQYERAAPRLEAARTVLPAHPALLNNLAVCHLRLGRPAEARTLLLAALTNGPPAAPPRFNVAMTYARQTNAAEALAWIEEARRYCTPAEAYAALADPDFDNIRRVPDFMAQVARLRELAGATPP